jgi:hypothetical protein
MAEPPPTGLIRTLILVGLIAVALSGAVAGMVVGAIGAVLFFTWAG